MHVVRHAAEDRVDDRSFGIATLFLVAVDLLNPLKIDHRHDADL